MPRHIAEREERLERGNRGDPAASASNVSGGWLSDVINAYMRGAEETRGFLSRKPRRTNSRRTNGRTASRRASRTRR